MQERWRGLCDYSAFQHSLRTLYCTDSECCWWALGGPEGTSWWKMQPWFPKLNNFTLAFATGSNARQNLQAGLALLIWREVLAKSKSWFLNQFFFLDCSRVWSITPNPILNFHRTTHQVMDVTIGHTYSMQHDFKPNTSREMESGKCRKYWRFYQQQRLAFAPIVT